MKKRPNLLNNLAIISDIVEKIDFISKDTTVIFELSRVEFEDIYSSMNNVTNDVDDLDTFTVTIGGVNFVFNTNSV